MTHTHTWKPTQWAHAYAYLPPPPTQFSIDTTHNIRCQGERGWGKRPTTSTAQTPPPSVELSAPPPFHVVVWVVGLLSLLCLGLGRVSITFLQVCICFLNWLTSALN